VAVTGSGLALPLGVVDVQPFVHRSNLPPDDPESAQFWRDEDGLFDNEAERWWRAVHSSDFEAASRGVRPIHVMDREADSYGLLSSMKAEHHRFVVRCDDQRKLKADSGLRDVGVLDVRLGERFALRSGSKASAHPPRRARDARLTVRAGTVALQRAAKESGASWSPGGWSAQPRTLELSLVEAVEREPPAGERGVRWLLLTTEPIETAGDVMYAHWSMTGDRSTGWRPEVLTVVEG